jgi:hypothetical protein
MRAIPDPLAVPEERRKWRKIRFALIPGMMISRFRVGRGVFNIEQSLKPDPGILTGIMGKNMG